jgi:hypothetical protein
MLKICGAANVELGEGKKNFDFLQTKPPVY